MEPANPFLHRDKHPKTPALASPPTKQTHGSYHGGVLTFRQSGRVCWSQIKDDVFQKQTKKKPKKNNPNTSRPVYVRSVTHMHACKPQSIIRVPPIQSPQNATHAH